MIIHEGQVRLVWARPRHLEQLADLFQACYSREQWQAEDFRDFAQYPERKNFIKVLTGETDEIVYSSLHYTIEEESCRIRRVAVWPDYRRRGLGRFMVGFLTGEHSPFASRRHFTVRIRPHEVLGLEFFVDGMGFRRARHLDGADRHGPYIGFEFTKPTAR